MFSAIKLQNELNTESSSNMIKWDVIYGNNLELIRERKSALSQLVENFIEIFSEDRIVYISRAPGRVNLMGRHIDHQGGFINTVAINKEILLAFSSREDKKIQIHNIKSDSFPSQLLSPNSLIDISPFADWTSFAKSAQVKEYNQKKSGDWSLYILAIYFRFQMHFKEIEFKGLDCVVSGNIPVGSGLSSSSALGVAFAKALLHINQISLSDKRLIELTGESELFVGFHGGNAEEVSQNLYDLDKFGDHSILFMNYRGYGNSDGRPGQNALFADALFIFDFISKKYHISPEKIILMGRSLGSAVAIHMASQRQVKAVLLVTPFDNLINIAKKNYPIFPIKHLLKHPFLSDQIAPRITCPMMAILGEQDQIIPNERSLALLEKWGGKSDYLIIENVGHNTISHTQEYWLAVNQFLLSTIKNSN